MGKVLGSHVLDKLAQLGGVTVEDELQHSARQKVNFPRTLRPTVKLHKFGYALVKLDVIAVLAGEKRGLFVNLDSKLVLDVLHQKVLVRSPGG